MIFINSYGCFPSIVIKNQSRKTAIKTFNERNFFKSIVVKEIVIEKTVQILKGSGKCKGINNDIAVSLPVVFLKPVP
jgi:hypothetical protein